MQIVRYIGSHKDIPWIIMHEKVSISDRGRKLKLKYEYSVGIHLLYICLTTELDKKNMAKYMEIAVGVIRDYFKYSLSGTCT